MKCFRKFAPPDQKNMFYTYRSFAGVRACKDFCWGHDKSTPYRSETNGIAERSSQGYRTLHFWFSRVFQKSGGEKQWNASVICETCMTTWQTASHRMKEDLELQSLRKTKSSASIREKDVSRTIHRIRAEFWRRLDRILDQTGLARFENYVASEVHVERFKSKEVGIKKLQEAFLSPCADRS